jgi:outer membrane protein assembly factor BamD (BamD/ComL family)
MLTGELFSTTGLALVLTCGLSAGADKSPQPAQGPRQKDSASVTKLAAARELYQKGQYGEAERIFTQVANSTRIPRPAVEEARCFQAHCQRHQGRYPAALLTYTKQLHDFPIGPYRQEALQHIFDIANYWLDDTRWEMKAWREWEEGKRLVALPAPMLHLDTGKPLLDEEGQAVRTLEWVYRTDPAGPLATKALWYAANVWYFRQAYGKAEADFSELMRRHPGCEYAGQTVQLTILCKLTLVRERGVDGGRLSEVSDLLDGFERQYPGNGATKDFLHQMRLDTDKLVAERGFRAADHQQRVGYLADARGRYEALCSRYPGTMWARQARQRLQALEAKKKQEERGDGALR